MHIVVFRTAYQSRTGDLLRERQLSWTTRRMRLFRWFPFRNRVQKYNFFPTWQIFCSIFLNYILLHTKHQPVAINIFSPNSPSAGCKNDIFIPHFSKNQPHERDIEKWRMDWLRMRFVIPRSSNLKYLFSNHRFHFVIFWRSVTTSKTKKGRNRRLIDAFFFHTRQWRRCNLESCWRFPHCNVIS